MVNQKLGKMFNTAYASGCENDIEFDTKFLIDHWDVEATCKHCKCSGKSESPADIETAFAKMLKEFQEKHDNLPSIGD